MPLCRRNELALGRKPESAKHARTRTVRTKRSGWSSADDIVAVPASRSPVSVFSNIPLGKRVARIASRARATNTFAKPPAAVGSRRKFAYPFSATPRDRRLYRNSPPPKRHKMGTRLSKFVFRDRCNKNNKNVFHRFHGTISPGADGPKDRLCRDPAVGLNEIPQLSVESFCRWTTCKKKNDWIKKCTRLSRTVVREPVKS